MTMMTSASSEPGRSSQISTLLNRLVKSLCGEGSDLDANLALSARLLCSRIEPRLPLDNVHLQQMISAMLFRRHVNSIEFDEQYAKLANYPLLRHTPSILYMLYALSSYNADGDIFCNPTILISSAPQPSVAAINVPPIDVVVSPSHSPVESPDTQYERIILRDVFYIVQGVDGDIIKFRPNSHGKVLIPDEIPSDAANLVRAMATLGHLFVVVSEAFAEPSTSCGRVRQALCSAVQNQITLFYRLLAVLESQCTNGSGLTLRQAYVWIQRPLKGMRALAMVAEVTRERSGGAIVSLIDQLNRHGDPYVAELLGTLVHAAATPLFEIMSRWATTGELEDLHGEFFIEEIRADGSPLAALSWSDQFVLRPERVPTCITEALAQRIYNLGRSVGFIRRFGDRPKWALKDNGNAVDIVYCDGIKLEGTIDRLAQAIHKRLVRVVLDQHRVVDHLRAAKDYLLMGQGDFVQSLMDLVFVELSRPAADISRHHLTSLLDSAIRSSTAQYDLQPCVQRLQVRLLQSSPADVGWDVFTLDYRTDDAPLSLLFPSEIRTAYLQIFRFMFRLKRIEHCLSDTWIRHNTDAARLATLPELARLFHRGHTIRHEMVQLVQNLTQFVKYDVVEDCWLALGSDIEQATDLDEIISAHKLYSTRLKDKLFLSGRQLPLQEPLSKLCDCILRFTTVQLRLHDAAIEELALRKYSSEAVSASRSASTQRVMALAARFQPQLDQLADTYRDNLLQFLGMFEVNDLTFLGLRLDSNGYYAALKLGAVKTFDEDDLLLQDLEGIPS